MTLCYSTIFAQSSPKRQQTRTAHMIRDLRFKSGSRTPAESSEMGAEALVETKKGYHGRKSPRCYHLRTIAYEITLGLISLTHARHWSPCAWYTSSFVTSKSKVISSFSVLCEESVIWSLPNCWSYPQYPVIHLMKSSAVVASLSLS